jgi:hypothetical protein
MAVQLGTTEGAFQTGSYSPTNTVKASAEYFVYDGGVSLPATWAMLADDAGVDGGFTLDLTSIGTPIDIDGGVVWSGSHGTVTLTLNPATGTTGQITGTATF